MMNKLAIRLLLIFLVVTPLAANVAYHYTRFGPYTANSTATAVLLKSSPTLLHTVVLGSPASSSACTNGSCYVFLLDTDSASQCTNAFPPTAPVIAAMSPGYDQSTATLIYDVTTTSGLCVVYNGNNTNLTVTWH
jgi:hypothetical protein